MKRIFSLAVILVFALSLSAQNQAETQPKKTKAPEITFEKTVHDYGQIYQNDNGECEFQFKNTGKEDLILTNCRSSCGCTVPEWPKEPIAPGKKAVIKVKYNTGRLGVISKSVTVESNAVNNRVELRITGNVNARPVESTPSNTETPLSTPNN